MCDARPAGRSADGRSGLDDALEDCRRQLGPRAHITVRQTAGLHEVLIRLGEPRHGDTPQWGVAARDLTHVLDELPRGVASLVADRELTARRRPLTVRLDGPGLLCPRAAGVLMHELVGHSSEADNYLENPLRTARLGDRLTTTPLTVRDRPGLVPYAGSYQYDDEGSAARTVTLLSDGRWTGLLTGRSTAWLSGGYSTGHSRGTTGSTSPRCSVLDVAPGQRDPTAMLQGISDGWLLGTPIGGYSVRHLLILELLWVRGIRSGALTDDLRGPAVVCADKRALAAGIKEVGSDPLVFSSPYRCVKEQHEVGSTVISPTVLLRRCILRPLAELDRVLKSGPLSEPAADTSS